MTMSHHSRSRTAVPVALTLALALPMGATGCGDAEAQTPTQVTAADLPCADFDPTLDEWESAGWPTATCDWVSFAGRTTYDVEHPLGRIPKSILLYVSFNPDGSSSTLASGDSGLIVSATESVITVRNNTEQRFYLRVVAR